GVAEAVRDLRAGDHVIVVSWLDRARRDVLTTHPRDDPDSPLLGVFSTRSPDRPNPIGLHRVQILAVEGLRIYVSDLEALDGTPILDIKPVLDRAAHRCPGGRRSAAPRRPRAPGLAPSKERVAPSPRREPGSLPPGEMPSGPYRAGGLARPVGGDVGAVRALGAAEPP